MAHPQKTKTFEAQLEDDIAEFYANPLGYVLYAFEWGQGDLEGHDGPDDWQIEQLQELGKGSLTPEQALQIAIASGHGIGKSAFCAWVILWFMSTRPECRVRATAGTKQQLGTVLWAELALWHKRSINKRWFKWTATKFYREGHEETWFAAAVTWSKSNFDAFAGLHARHVLMIFDEASAIDDQVSVVADGAMSTPGAIWLKLGNPTKNTGDFRECFGKNRSAWKTWHIDSRAARMTNKLRLQQLIDRHGIDSDYVKVRILGQFPSQACDQFIGEDTVEEAIKRLYAANDYDYAPKIFGLDCARYGDDRSVLVLRQGRHAEIIGDWAKLDTVELAGKVASLIHEHKPKMVCIDVGANGAGVIDILNHSGFGDIVKEVNFGWASTRRDCLNKRVAMWAGMRDWLPDADIPDFERLKDDLTAPTYWFDAGGTVMKLESKEDMRDRGLASPDYGDALALTFAYPVRSDMQDAQQKLRKPPKQYTGLSWVG